MTTKKTAPAAQSAVAEVKKLIDARFYRFAQIEGETTHPAIFCKGDEPGKGDTVSFEVEGTEYHGVVGGATSADGELLVEFSQPLKVNKPK
jgi:hypothetical protein